MGASSSFGIYNLPVNVLFRNITTARKLCVKLDIRDETKLRSPQASSDSQTGSGYRRSCEKSGAMSGFRNDFTSQYQSISPIRFLSFGFAFELLIRMDVMKQNKNGVRTGCVINNK